MRRPRSAPALVIAAAFALGGCGLSRARRPDVPALVARGGLDGAADDLTLRIAADPQDVGARLALAEIEERRGRPGAALRELLAAERLGGPTGSQLTADDRARLARLLAARGTERAARGAPSAPADLSRASELGATVEPTVALRAQLGAAIAELRHSDARIRAQGHARLARLVAEGASDPRLVAADVVGAVSAARLGELARAGVWLWDAGARRAALEALDAWERAGGLGAPAAPDAPDRWLRARRWWRGPDGRPDLVTLRRAVAAGASPCVFAVAGAPPCSAVSAVVASGDSPELGDLLEASAQAPRTADPDEAAAWLIVALRASLDGGAPWDDLVRARVDVAALAARPGALPPFARATALRLAGGEVATALERAIAGAGAMPPGPRLVVAAEAARAGRSAAEVRELLGDVAATHDGAALLVAVAPPTPPLPDLAPSAARFAARGAPAGDDEPALAAVAAAHRRDAALGDRRADELVARRVDAAPPAARLSALYDALGDAARARRWAEAAAAASPGEAPLLLLHAVAAARAGDPAASRVLLGNAAAASGDPGAALTTGARALLESGAPAEALDALKLALQLLAPGQRGDAARLVVDASAALERAAPPAIEAEAAPVADVPTDVEVQLAALRWRPRDVALRAALARALPASDPRRARAVGELAALAGDADDRTARAAIAALRGLVR